MEKSCWWIEGGLCYLEHNRRNTTDGRSCVKCNGVCKGYISKREFLSQFIPSDKLIIMSEESNINENSIDCL